MLKDFWEQDAIVVVGCDLSAPLGQAHYSKLKYSHIAERVSRLRIQRDDWLYEIFGSFQARDAMHMAWALPPASSELNGIRATAGHSFLVEPSEQERRLGATLRRIWHFRIDDPGESHLAEGAVYNTWAFGLKTAEPRLWHISKFPTHSALVSLRDDTPTGRPRF